MINILDKKGNPLGLPYDYEYRGVNRESNRDAPMKRTNALCIVFAILFALPGLIVIVKGFNGTDSESIGGVLFALLFSFGLSVLFIWFMIAGNRKHKQLLERIEKP